jgi:hypothetical protein
MNKPESSPAAADPHDQESEISWSPGVRTVATIAILFFLFVIVIAPLANPIGSASFTIPLAKAVSPIHRALFLGHGYRFFGPDPGPSHLVDYIVTRSDGSQVQGRFPDRQRYWPRLLYHRWFMLSETIYREHMLTPDRASFDQSQQQLSKEILAVRADGKFSIAAQLEQRRLEQESQYQNARRRIDDLVNSLAQYLASANDGERTQLVVRERLIAGPLDVIAGIPLNDERYLSPPIPIGPGLEEMPARSVAPPVRDGLPTEDVPHKDIADPVEGPAK